MLMKMFSHAAYAVTRISVDSKTACMDMLTTLFTVPTWGTNLAGGYETRDKADIQLCVSF